MGLKLVKHNTFYGFYKFMYNIPTVLDFKAKNYTLFVSVKWNKQINTLSENGLKHKPTVSGAKTPTNDIIYKSK
jgi:hypothetical protein